MDLDGADREVSAIMDDDDDSDSKPTNSGIVVTGEASESEEEINSSNPIPSFDSDSRRSKRVLIQDFASAETIDFNVQEKPEPIKHNTLLHRKLREKNVNLHRNLSYLVNRPLNSAIDGISNVTQQLTKTQIAVQELSPLLRQMTNKLFHLEDKVDFFRDNTAALPNIQIKINQR